MARRLARCASLREPALLPLAAPPICRPFAQQSHVAPLLIQDSDEDANRCRSTRTDGTRCGRPVFDFELCACKLHVDVARRAAEYAARAAEEEQRERGEREAKGEEETDPTELAVSNKLGARVGINIEIPDGPIQSERAKDEDTLPAGLPPPPAPAPVKPAPWAAHKDGASPNPGADAPHNPSR